MRILLDECVNPRLRQAFPDHEVLTVAKAKWRALPDAKLIAQAQGQCDVMVTIDQGFEHEHNLKKLSFGIVIVHVPRNRMEYYRPLFPAFVGRRRARKGRPSHPCVGAAGIGSEKAIMNLERLARITIEQGKCGGRPCIRGQRIRVTDVLQRLGAGASFEEILADHPSLEREDILDAIDYAAYHTDHVVLRTS